MNYIIKTSGRTGSHILLDYFIKQQNCWPIWNLPHGFNNPLDFNQHSNFVIHDRQNNFIPADTSNWVCVLNFRKNKFEQILSYLTAISTNEFAFYSEKPLEISADPNDFKNAYYRIIDEERRMRDSVNSLDWYTIKTVYFEDFVENPIVLKTIFSYNESNACVLWNRPISERSPRNKRQVFKNYEELLYLYKQLECVQI